MIRFITFISMLINVQLGESNLKYRNPNFANHATLKEYGAVGDGITDDTQAITKALSSPTSVIEAQPTHAYYKVSNTLLIQNIKEKTFIVTGAKILNTDLNKATFLFQDCKNIKILGGEFGYKVIPTVNGGNSQHVFQFDHCQNIVLNKIHIRNSPEMGVAITNSNFVTIKNSLIEHTFRDGIYAHYSANVSYIKNIFKNIKDDAMSFHDYGIDSEKISLRKFGYKQAANILVQGNTVENVYQGFGSIGACKIKVINNKFKNTVIAGIAVFNSNDLYPTGTAVVDDTYIYNNSIVNACKDQKINNIMLVNNGQASTGRAAIFIGSLGKNNQLNAGEVKRLKNITVKKNSVNNSGADGFTGNKIDNLNFSDNTFLNCSGQILAKSLQGDVIELGDITSLVANNNTVIDNRPTVLHQHGYTFNNVSGKMSNWHIRGVIAQESLLLNSKSLITVPNKKGL